MNILILFAVTFIPSIISIRMSPKVHPRLVRKLEREATANIFISFSEGVTEVLNSLKVRSSEFQTQTRSQRMTFLKNSLMRHLDTFQEPVLGFLSQQPFVTTTSFWSTNQIYVTNAHASLIERIASLENVAEIKEEQVFEPLEPVQLEEDHIDNDDILSPLGKISWGIKKIRADSVWSHKIFRSNGTGVRIGIIDTGVQHNHEALSSNYVGTYGWYDPYTRTSVPTDRSGHGTHVAGIIVGKNGIGVAPGGKWMACRGCETLGCRQSALLKCGEFMACPTLPNGKKEDCTKAPSVINNSWGGGQGNEFFSDIIRLWKLADIVPVFAVGNSGPTCRSALSPGDNEDLISVGATTSGDGIAFFSSKGPSVLGFTKPEVVAPGSNIRSSFKGSKYRLMSGSSMATPHVTGVVALMKSFKPVLTYREIRTHLFKGAIKGKMKKVLFNCGAQSGSWPNNVYGHGRLNALGSLKSIHGERERKSNLALLGNKTYHY